eukprot:358532-Chlamydomonas_euryale.AAC.4
MCDCTGFGHLPVVLLLWMVLCVTALVWGICQWRCCWGWCYLRPRWFWASASGAAAGDGAIGAAAGDVATCGRAGFGHLPVALLLGIVLLAAALGLGCCEDEETILMTIVLLAAYVDVFYMYDGLPQGTPWAR